MLKYSKSKNKKGDVTHYYNCQSCNNLRQRKWYHTNPIKGRENNYKSNRNNAIKVKARQAVKSAILSGKLIKPKRCSLCPATVIQAHHHDYSKPLEVEWLCIICHTKKHRS